MDVVRLVRLFFFLNEPAPTEIYPLPLHDALPISTSALDAQLLVEARHVSGAVRRHDPHAVLAGRGRGGGAPAYAPGLGIPFGWDAVAVHLDPGVARRDAAPGLLQRRLQRPANVGTRGRVTCHDPSRHARRARVAKERERAELAGRGRERARGTVAGAADPLPFALAPPVEPHATA